MEAAVVHGWFSATYILHFYYEVKGESHAAKISEKKWQIKKTVTNIQSLDEIKQNRPQWRTEAAVVHGWFSATEILHFGFLQRKEAEYGCSSSQQIMI